MDYSYALYLASLPYNRYLYRSGGWGIVSSTDIQSLIDDFFIKEDIKKAQCVANAVPRSRRFRLGGINFYLDYLSIWDVDYPYCLKNIYDPPPVLFLGIPEYLLDSENSLMIKRKSILSISTKSIAIVGTRQASHLCYPIISHVLNCFKNQQQKTLEEVRASLVSGFAIGVDAIAHYLALEKKIPTWVVLGSGLLHCGPSSNHRLFNKAQRQKSIILLVSEFLPTQVGRPYLFPRRNRIIAGLSNSVYVIQAPKKSGALITANYALEEGRDLWVFDHEIFRKIGVNNEGCRMLLEQGAYHLDLPKNVLSKIISPLHLNDFSEKEIAVYKKYQRQLFSHRLQGIKPLGRDYYLLESETTMN